MQYSYICETLRVIFVYIDVLYFSYCLYIKTMIECYEYVFFIIIVDYEDKTLFRQVIEFTKQSQTNIFFRTFIA
jgi:hypothetical protein